MRSSTVAHLREGRHASAELAPTISPRRTLFVRVKAQFVDLAAGVEKALPVGVLVPTQSAKAQLAFIAAEASA